MPPAVVGAITGVASIGSSLFGASNSASAAAKAATAQAEAAKYAADLQNQAENRALGEQQRQFDTSQGNLAPYLSAGKSALASLLTGLGYENQTPSSLSASAPTVYSPRYYELKNSIPDMQAELDRLNQQKAELSKIGGGQALFSGVNVPLRTKQLNQQIAETTNELQKAQAEFGELGSQPQTSGTQIQETAAQGNEPVSLGQFTKPFEFNQNEDPSVQFRLQEGQKAIERSAAAKGGALGGAALKALTRYAQDFASNEYQNAYNRFQSERDSLWNRYASLAGVGQTASSQSTQAGQNYANSVSNILQNSANQQGEYATQAANARASGYVGSANAWNQGISGALQSGLGAFNVYDILKRKN